MTDPRICSRLSAIAVIAAAVLLLASCGSSSSSGNTSSSEHASSRSNTSSGGNASSRSNTSSSGRASSRSNTSSGPDARGRASRSAPTTTGYLKTSATVIGKRTDVLMTPAVKLSLKQAGITLTAVAPASAKTTLLLPISGGQVVVPTLVGTVDQTGGLTFSRSGKSVTLEKFVINTATKQLTASVRRQSMPVFDLNLASLRRAGGPHGIVTASNVALTVTPRAATALNSGLGVNTFQGGMNFGIAALTVVYARGHR